jgi:hypothetical protein
MRVEKSSKSSGLDPGFATVDEEIKLNRKQRRARMKANRQYEKLRQKQILRSIRDNKLHGKPLMPGLIGPDQSPKKEEAKPELPDKPEIIL